MSSKKKHEQMRAWAKFDNQDKPKVKPVDKKQEQMRAWAKFDAKENKDEQA